MPTAFPYRDKLQGWLAQNYLKEIAESLISEVDEHADPGAASLRSDAINLLGRLRSAQREYNTGQLSREDFELLENQIRSSLSDMIGSLKPDWMYKTKKIELPVNPPRDSLDQVFKLILLTLSLLAIGLLIYTIFFNNKPEEKLPFTILSVVGGSGAFYGYGRWRIIELQYKVS